MHTTFLIHAFCFAVGFWWVSYQREIEFSKIVFSLVGGAALAGFALWGSAFLAHDSIWGRTPIFSLSAVLGASFFHWLRAREQLTQKMTRESVYLLTLSFMYFFSPWSGPYKTVGILGTLPCLGVLAFCWRKNDKEEGRVGLMFWAMLVSIVMGVLQFWIAPESFMPPKSMSFANPQAWMLTALQAAGLVTLAFNVVPFFDWVRESLVGNPFGSSHYVENEGSASKRMLHLTLIHGAPLALNWKFQYFSYDAMMTYTLVWSPIVANMLADAMGPAPKSEVPGWESDATRVS